MHVVSLNVGGPREVEWRGRLVRTSIWKEPVQGAVRVTSLNLDGDAQSDLSVHGGPDKAVYAYPAEHYDYWQRELDVDALPWAAFGENLTTSGILEPDIAIGDRVRAGSAELMVTQPRLPCFKLGIRFGRDDMVKRFLQSGRSGFYFTVVREGEITAGDRLEIAVRDTRGVTVSDMIALETADEPDRDLLRRALETPALPESWKRHFRKRFAAI
jgi:MOSC domain-containing protein YiiM